MIDFDDFAGSEAEMDAWTTYIRTSNSQMLLGRGPYAIQIDHYCAAVERIGNPVRFPGDTIGATRHQTYDEILPFIGLSSHELTDTSQGHETPYSAAPLSDHHAGDMRSFMHPIVDASTRCLDGTMYGSDSRISYIRLWL
jgi:hypothetical protein